MCQGRGAACASRFVRDPDACAGSSGKRATAAGANGAREPRLGCRRSRPVPPARRCVCAGPRRGRAEHVMALLFSGLAPGSIGGRAPCGRRRVAALVLPTNQEPRGVCARAGCRRRRRRLRAPQRVPVHRKEPRGVRGGRSREIRGLSRGSRLLVERCPEAAGGRRQGWAGRRATFLGEGKGIEKADGFKSRCLGPPLPQHSPLAAGPGCSPSSLWPRPQLTRPWPWPRPRRPRPRRGPARRSRRRAARATRRGRSAAAARGAATWTRSSC